MFCPVGAVMLKVSVSPFPPPWTNWLVTVSPLGAFIDSKSGTPRMVTDSVSSESAAFRMMPNGADPPAATVRDEGAVKVGVSASLSVSSVAPVMTFFARIVCSVVVEM